MHYVYSMLLLLSFCVIAVYIDDAPSSATQLEQQLDRLNASRVTVDLDIVAAGKDSES